METLLLGEAWLGLSISEWSLGKHQGSKVILQPPPVKGSPWLTDIEFLTVFLVLEILSQSFSWACNVLHVPRVNKDLFFTGYIIVVLLKILTKALSATIAVVSRSFSNCICFLDKINRNRLS